MTRHGPCAAVLALFAAAAAAAPCPAQSSATSAAAAAAAPRFALSADTVLLDETVRIALSGLPPDQLVTIRLTGVGPARIWRSAATFRADGGGRVDLATATPLSGSYQGAHPMGLIWSAVRDSAARPTGPAGPLGGPQRTPEPRAVPPQGLELSAEVAGRVVAVDTLWRLAMAPTVRAEAVRERGLVGTVYLPAGAERRPAVIVLGGSLGGITPPNGIPGGLASRGYVVLSLGYFAAEGLPEELANIPLEYFGTALRWLAEHPSVDSSRLAVVGVSRGGELALLVGATYPAVRAVVAYVPSHVAWPGPSAATVRPPAWTLGGRPVPWMHATETAAAVARQSGCRDAAAAACAPPLTLHRFLARLEDSAAAARAEIPVERINGPVLLISGREDRVWPSTLMADRVVARLRRTGFRHPVEHHAYAGAGHAIGRPYVPAADLTVPRANPSSGHFSMPGGTAEATALASEDAWRKMLAFLERSLGAPR
jgi:dienelactone hydrolase